MYSKIYEKNILQTNIQLSPLEYNQDIDLIILEKLKEKMEGKCDNNGYIKKGSCKILMRGLGELQQSQFNGSCLFSVKYSVEICTPVEGSIYKCIVKNKNKMGLFCELVGEEDSPLNIILAKQHHLNDDVFDTKNINDIIDIEIIGVKIEYREVNICCIGHLLDKNNSIEEQENNDIDDLNNTEDLEDMEDLEDVEDIDNVEDLEDMDNVEDVEDMEDMDNVEEKENKNISELMDIEIKDNEDSFDVGENVDLSKMEGVQNIEDIDDKTTGDSELEELGEDFTGEVLDLDDVISKDLVPVYNSEEMEYYDKPIDKEVYKLKCLTSNQYKTFAKPRKTVKNYMNYFIYIQLNNIMLEFYDKNGIEVKKIMLGKNNKYKNEIKIFLNKLGKSLKVEEVDGLTYVL